MFVCVCACVRLGILWETSGSGGLQAHSVGPVWIYLACDWKVKSQDGDYWPDGETGRVNKDRNIVCFHCHCFSVSDSLLQNELTDSSVHTAMQKKRKLDAPLSLQEKQNHYSQSLEVCLGY